MPKPKISNDKFWKFVNLNDEETELQLYSDIASSKWWDDDESVTPKLFISELKAVGSNNICVRINSNGGDVFAANAIAVALEEASKNGKNVTCKIDGICASAAVRVALACSKISIANGAYMMIHKPANVLWGYYNADDMRKLADTLDTIQNGIVDAYVARTGLTDKECSKMMDKETWFTAKEAVEKGFADEILFADGETEENDNGATIDRIKNAFVASAVATDYSNVPKALQEAFANKQNKKEEEGKPMEIKNYDDLKAAYPDLVANAENKARNEGIENAVTAERERLKALDGLAGKIDNALIDEAKYGEKKMSADEVIVKAFKEDKMCGNGSYLNAAKADAEETDKVEGEAAGDEKSKAAKDEEEAKNLLMNAVNARIAGGKK